MSYDSKKYQLKQFSGKDQANKNKDLDSIPFEDRFSSHSYFPFYVNNMEYPDGYHVSRMHEMLEKEERLKPSDVEMPKDENPPKD